MQSQNRFWQGIFSKKMLICIFTGFTSGLPLYILISLLPAWLRSHSLDLKSIGLFALIQLPYTWKFLWAPFFDRIGWVMGRRRGWLFFFQILLLISIPLLGFFNPQKNLMMIILIATLIAFLSASQDVVIDAYRRELLIDKELGLGNAVHVNAYKIASLIPGSLSLILADHFNWQTVFMVTSLFMLPGLLLTFFIKEPRVAHIKKRDLKSSILLPFQEFINRHGIKSALMILLFIFLYKLGDSMATALATPFYLDLGFSKTEIGLIAKNAGLWPSVIGGLIGGVWMMRLGINRALWLFGALQMVSILGFAWLAHMGYSPKWLALVVGFEAFGVGLGTTAFVAFIAKTTHPLYTATQFALFTSLAAIPRTFANASTGYLVGLVGWENFFVICFLLAIPGMALLFKVAPFKY
ncbi:MAG: MFS transporter [Candidatus Methylopumilus sp.]|nr:MFS transporter [Candidatus Methylopumilus sp.]